MKLEFTPASPIDDVALSLSNKIHMDTWAMEHLNRMKCAEEGLAKRQVEQS